MTLTTNAEYLVCMSVIGQIAPPASSPLPGQPYQLNARGESYLLPGFGGIVYNVSVGDPAYGWLADCVQPGVSISQKDGPANQGLSLLACVGNTAVVTTGEARNAQGVVTGKSGRFSEQVMIHFEKSIRRKMAIGDKITVRAQGAGLQLDGHSNIKLKSCSPELLQALNIAPGGKVRVPVVGVIPPQLIGAGVGLPAENNPLHIQTSDRAALKNAGLDSLRLGDIVAIADYDCTWSHSYRQGAVSIGVISQGDSPRGGYGPGITLLMTCAEPVIEPVITPNMNLKDLLKLPA